MSSHIAPSMSYKQTATTHFSVQLTTSGMELHLYIFLNIFFFVWLLDHYVSSFVGSSSFEGLIVQAGLTQTRMTLSFWSFCLHLLSARITTTSHHAYSKDFLMRWLTFSFTAQVLGWLFYTDYPMSLFRLSVSLLCLFPQNSTVCANLLGLSPIHHGFTCWAPLFLLAWDTIQKTRGST